MWIYSICEYTCIALNPSNFLCSPFLERRQHNIVVVGNFLGEEAADTAPAEILGKPRPRALMWDGS